MTLGLVFAAQQEVEMSRNARRGRAGGAGGRGHPRAAPYAWPLVGRSNATATCSPAARNVSVKLRARESRGGRKSRASSSCPGCPVLPPNELTYPPPRSSSACTEVESHFSI